jgi:hypothetical protein
MYPPQARRSLARAHHLSTEVGLGGLPARGPCAAAHCAPSDSESLALAGQVSLMVPRTRDGKVGLGPSRWEGGGDGILKLHGHGHCGFPLASGSAGCQTSAYCPEVEVARHRGARRPGDSEARAPQCQWPRWQTPKYIPGGPGRPAAAAAPAAAPAIPLPAAGLGIAPGREPCRPGVRTSLLVGGVLPVNSRLLL